MRRAKDGSRMRNIFIRALFRFLSEQKFYVTCILFQKRQSCQVGISRRINFTFFFFAFLLILAFVQFKKPSLGLIENLMYYLYNYTNSQYLLFCTSWIFIFLQTYTDIHKITTLNTNCLSVNLFHCQCGAVAQTKLSLVTPYTISHTRKYIWQLCES